LLKAEDHSADAETFFHITLSVEDSEKSLTQRLK
jgi:hypothetical protein